LNDVLEDPYWVNVLRRTGHRGRDDFNRIQVDPEDGHLSLSVAPLHDFVVPLKSLFPPPTSTAVIPFVTISELQDRRFLSGPIDRCTWMGKNVVFKQILRGWVHATRVWREITLLNQLRGSSSFLPILAYVVDDEVRTRGFLLPYAGLSIDETSNVQWSYFRDVLQGLCEIHDIPACHGDVFPRNILVNDGKAWLIDPGNEGLDYKGDRQALIDTITSLRSKAMSDMDVEKMDSMCSMLSDSSIELRTILTCFSNW
jgi:serine/threonine protein kinase